MATGMLFTRFFFDMSLLSIRSFLMNTTILVMNCISLKLFLRILFCLPRYYYYFCKR